MTVAPLAGRVAKPPGAARAQPGSHSITRRRPSARRLRHDARGVRKDADAEPLARLRTLIGAATNGDGESRAHFRGRGRSVVLDKRRASSPSRHRRKCRQIALGPISASPAASTILSSAPSCLLAWLPIARVTPAPKCGRVERWWERPAFSGFLEIIHRGNGLAAACGDASCLRRELRRSVGKGTHAEFHDTARTIAGNELRTSAVSK